MKTAREIRPEIPINMSTANETQEDERDQTSGQGSNEMVIQSVRTPDVDMLSPGPEISELKLDCQHSSHKGCVPMAV